jgi:hypothetical protein
VRFEVFAVVNENYSRFQVFTEAIVTMAVFWVGTPRGVVEVYRCFRNLLHPSSGMMRPDDGGSKHL